MVLAGLFTASGGFAGSNPTDGQPGGPGGSGGVMRHWGDGSLFDDTKVVSNFGGSGNPNGTDPPRTAEGPPSSLTIDGSGVLAFTPSSPDAEAYRIMRSLGGAPVEVFLETAQTSGIQATAPVCVPATFYVHAYHAFFGWVSPSPQPVAWLTHPSIDQTCSDAPNLSARKKMAIPAAKLRRRKGRLTIKFRSDGIGRFDARVLGQKAAKKGGAKNASKAGSSKQKSAGPTRIDNAPPPPKPGVRAISKSKKVNAKKKRTVVLVSATGELTKKGKKKVKLRLPKAGRKPGRYTIRLIGYAPDGTSKTKTNINLEVRP